MNEYGQLADQELSLPVLVNRESIDSADFESRASRKRWKNK